MTRNTDTLVEAWFDGACEPQNPGGHGAAGIVIKIDDRSRHATGIYCGSGAMMSNNVAEYMAVIAALEWLDGAGLAETARTLRFYGDSALVVHQLRGEWAARGGLYLPHYERAKTLLIEMTDRCPGSVEVRWIPRHANSEADALARRALEVRGISCRTHAPRRAGRIPA